MLQLVRSWKGSAGNQAQKNGLSVKCTDGGSKLITMRKAIWPLPDVSLIKALQYRWSEFCRPPRRITSAAISHIRNMKNRKTRKMKVTTKAMDYNRNYSNNCRKPQFVYLFCRITVKFLVFLVSGASCFYY